jgi:hypothetical protein
MTISRRRFLRQGLVGGLLLATAGLGLYPTREPFLSVRPLRFLDKRQFAILVAIAARTVEISDEDAALVAHRVDELLVVQSPEARRDLKRLLYLFENALCSALFDHRLRPFSRLSPKEQVAALEAWRDSRLVLRRAGYQALRKLTQAAYYSDPATWSQVGYPGPPTLMVPT